MPSRSRSRSEQLADWFGNSAFTRRRSAAGPFRRRAIAVVALAVAAPILSVGVPAGPLAGAVSPGGSVGAGISSEPITLPGSGVPGTTYRLQGLVVANTGATASHFGLRVRPLHKKGELGVDPGWVTFQPDTFSLGPDASRKVTVVVSLPPSVDRGQYTSYVVAATVPPHGGSDGAASAAAATTLSFAVKGAPPGSGFPWFDWLGVGVILLLAAALVAVWRSGLRISVHIGR